MGLRMLRGIACDRCVEGRCTIAMVVDARGRVAAVLYGGGEGVCAELDVVGVESGGARHRAAAIHLLIRRLIYEFCNVVTS